MIMEEIEVHCVMRDEGEWRGDTRKDKQLGGDRCMLRETLDDNLERRYWEG